MEQIRLISSDLDGGELRRELVKDKYFLRCCGANDNQAIQEVSMTVGKTQFSISPSRWEEIFGDNS